MPNVVKTETDSARQEDTVGLQDNKVILQSKAGLTHTKKLEQNFCCICRLQMSSQATLQIYESTHNYYNCFIACNIQSN